MVKETGLSNSDSSWGQLGVSRSPRWRGAGGEGEFECVPMPQFLHVRIVAQTCQGALHRPKAWRSDAFM